jgi:hypothetical protein
MSLEQIWKVEAFAARIMAAKAGVDLAYVRNGHWSASSTGPAGEISLLTPGGENWPRLEGLMRNLVAVGIVEAKVVFRGMPPVFASDPAKLPRSTLSTMAPGQYAKVSAFAVRARSPGTTVDLRLRSDGLWYVHATGPDGPYSLSPNFGDGWGRLEGLLQVLAGAGLTESQVSFEGLPPALLGGDRS